LGGIIHGIVGLILADADRKLDALFLLSSLGYFLGGLGAGCVLWALAYLVHRLHDLAVAQGNRAKPLPWADERAGASDEAAAVGPGSIDSATVKRILAELSDINDSLLLSEDERKAKRETRRSRLAEALTAEAEQAIEAHDFQRAERAADRLRDEAADGDRSDRLTRRIADARAAVQAEDIAAQARRIEELMSVASFSQAEEIARQLAARYTDSPDARALLDRVLREADAFIAEQRKRLFQEVQQSASARQWRAAFASARRLLAEHPKSLEADKIALTMPTIQENARIEEARQLRDDIRDLIQRRRYHEALGIAQDILARFPDTQAAAELRPQLDRLEQLAEGEEETRP
jgi:hypothetical protein